jgi:uncharacterized protein YjgD (DUF1641 family)
MTTAISSTTLEERLDRVSAQVEEIAADLRRQRESREQWEELALVARLQSTTELISEVTSLSGAGVAKLSDVLAKADRKGYFVVARGGATVVDRLVASYADEDFEALGDTLVLLLRLAKEMTKPEVIVLLERIMTTLHEGQSTKNSPPSTFALLKQLHDPQTRRGLARALALLQTAGAEPPTEASAPGNTKG